MIFLIDNYQTQVGSAEEWNPKELEFIICAIGVPFGRFVVSSLSGLGSI